MAATKVRFEIADEDYECNASLFIKDCMEDILTDLNEEEKIAVELAQSNNWHVKKGDNCRRYTWDEGESEEMDCVEIPAMAEICIRLDLWP